MPSSRKRGKTCLSVARFVRESRAGSLRHTNPIWKEKTDGFAIYAKRKFFVSFTCKLHMLKRKRAKEKSAPRGRLACTLSTPVGRV